MDIYINDKQVDSDKYIGGNLSAILEEINKSLDSKVVREVICDGKELNPNNLESNPRMSEIDKLEVRTIKAEDLIKQTMADLQEYLPKVIKGFDQAAAQLNLDNQSNGYATLNYALQGLRWSMDVIQHGAKLSDNEKLIERFNKTSQSLNTLLNTIRDRIDKGNSDELVTIISQSFQPELDRLQAMADELVHHYEAEDVEPQVDDGLIDKE